MDRIAIVYIFYDPEKKKFLIENRTKEQFLAGEKLFPGGKVEPNEKDDFEKTLRREVYEELGVKIVEFVNFNKKVKGLAGFKLYPFLITKWKGKIPKTIIDKGSKLEWIGIDDFKPTLVPVKKLLGIAKKGVVQCY